MWMQSGPLVEFRPKLLRESRILSRQVLFLPGIVVQLVFDARNFFDSPAAPIPPFRQNQFGGAVGGPVRKSRTFFFLSYEGQRIRKSLTQTFSVPTAAMRK